MICSAKGWVSAYPFILYMKEVLRMDRELRRAELAAKFKASFDSSDISYPLNIYTRIMNDVYFWQKEDIAYEMENPSSMTRQSPEKSRRRATHNDNN